MSSPEQYFVNAWKVAEPRLRELNEQSLRELDRDAGAKGLARQASAESMAEAQFSGLAVSQSWMMRLRVLSMTTDVSVDEPRDNPLKANEQATSENRKPRVGQP